VTGAASTGVPAPAAIQIVVVDASIWVSRLLTHDPNNARATAWIARHVRSGGILTAPTLIAVEVAASVSRRTGNVTDAHAAAGQLYGLPFVRLAPIDQTLIVEATNLSANLGLRGADAIYVALAKQLGIPLLTLDAEQLIRPAGLIATIQP
jgi:predicted nucleic acid-binding protein